MSTMSTDTQNRGRYSHLRAAGAKGAETSARRHALARLDRALADVERTGGRLTGEHLARAAALAERTN